MPRLSRLAWLLAPPAVAVGAGTHVLWDSATHDWGFIVRELTLLWTEYGALPGYAWLQHTSTVAGSTVVAAYGLLRLRRQPVNERAAEVPRPGFWLSPVPLAALTVGIGARDSEAAVGAALLALLGVSVVWRAVPR